jgi:hypothetical protein
MPFFGELEVDEYTPKDKGEQSEAEVIEVTSERELFLIPSPFGRGLE